jgi:hypothetical protein
MLYSKQTGGFYLPEIHGTNTPPDAVEITAKYHQELMEGQVLGMTIRANEQGMPVLVPPPVPSAEEVLAQWRDQAEVSRFQGRAALLQAGYLADVEAYMTQPDTDPFIKLAWQDAQVFRRNSPTVAQLQELLNLSSTQLDDLFRFAATISA